MRRISSMLSICSDYRCPKGSKLGLERALQARRIEEALAAALDSIESSLPQDLRARTQSRKVNRSIIVITIRNRCGPATSANISALVMSPIPDLTASFHNIQVPYRFYLPDRTFTELLERSAVCLNLFLLGLFNRN